MVACEFVPELPQPPGRIGMPFPPEQGHPLAEDQDAALVVILSNERAHPTRGTAPGRGSRLP